MMTACSTTLAPICPTVPLAILTTPYLISTTKDFSPTH